ncbi:hypothetical protein NCAS_0H01360 [Naumovozyma castellii]|uniref:Glucosidase II subunit alpha n=1 Tax=Naumovozyma castellii TaxID=27288 RepID=G0VIW9_NAUCA|nr:hypothetical protein NCAS_0H01360 [Naumovozyma castellii CBS 4309]CCC71446.1 hypothetical protein NCAS_0H01360 [Naumovozyma castellii CBS 4309]
MLLSYWIITLTVWLCQFRQTTAFTDYLLKKCSQSGFCQRNRDYAKNIQSSKNIYYRIDESSIAFNETAYTLTANILKTIPRSDIDDIIITLPFTLNVLNESNAIRFTIDEQRNSPDGTNKLLQPERFNSLWKWAFDPKASLQAREISMSRTTPVISQRSWFDTFFHIGEDPSEILLIEDKTKNIKIELALNKFEIRVFHHDEIVLSINDRNLLNLEHQRSIENNFQNVLPEESTFNMFADDFEYSKDDTIPFGPESVALDFNFHNFQNVFGIPEHADSLRLKDTIDDEPYRLFNVDVFEYNLDSRMPMYGAIPLMFAANKKQTVGTFWLNAADTWIDIHYDDMGNTQTHWISESGNIDVLIFLGDTPADVLQDYTTLTGKPVLPLLSSLGYHQCRWNYNDELDVLTVESEMDKAGIPFDFIWLDLEYTDNKQYFTWKPDSFPNPRRLLSKLAELGRHLTVLIDPHLKVDYNISDIVAHEGVAVQNNKGRVYEGHCWPGASIWIDTMFAKGQTIWARFFKDFVPHGITNLHIWNDMNEPSIFSGPETTAPKDLIHADGLEERSIHNVYGMTVHETTYNSMKEIFSPQDKRPFLLTRSFFAGSQRSAAAWTGDNQANWDYLRMSIPMCLTNNIVGMPFIGADVAGFEGNPEPELIARWYQTGLWYPFFRAHAHIDSIRREPYLFQEPISTIVKDAIRLRYSLLPTFYTSFKMSSINGGAIMKPMFFEKPQYEDLYPVDNQFYLGDSGILVKPITTKDQFTTEMVFVPGIYYDLDNLTAITINGKDVASRTIDAPLEKIPAFIEGGHIITRRDRYRRSSKLMHHDPYTIILAPDLNGNASGRLYVDDGETFGYEKGNFVDTQFSLSEGKIIQNEVLHASNDDKSVGNTKIETVIIAIDGMPTDNIQETATIKIGSKEHTVAIEKSDNDHYLTIKNPLIRIDENWTIAF